ncbi:MAG: hypothetical protein AB6733_09125 [Clostridiaceae bacterium]
MINVSFGKGRVKYEEFNIDITKPLENQVWGLKEDLLQVDYSEKEVNTYVIDVGWYPELDLKGNFRIVIIRNFDWVNSVINKTSNVENFYGALTDCIGYANRKHYGLTPETTSKIYLQSVTSSYEILDEKPASSKLHLKVSTVPQGQCHKAKLG